MQNTINHMQNRYRQWLANQTVSEQCLAMLDERWQIFDELMSFYFSEQFRQYYQAIEQGEQADLTTQGEYSVMNQDTLWDALADEQAFYQALFDLSKNRLSQLKDSNLWQDKQ